MTIVVHSYQNLWFCLIIENIGSRIFEYYLFVSFLFNIFTCNWNARRKKQQQENLFAY
jgi:hypothetical protein